MSENWQIYSKQKVAESTSFSRHWKSWKKNWKKLKVHQIKINHPLTITCKFTSESRTSACERRCGKHYIFSFLIGLIRLPGKPLLKIGNCFRDSAPVSPVSSTFSPSLICCVLGRQDLSLPVSPGQGGFWFQHKEECKIPFGVTRAQECHLNQCHTTQAIGKLIRKYHTSKDRGSDRGSSRGERVIKWHLRAKSVVALDTRKGSVWTHIIKELCFVARNQHGKVKVMTGKTVVNER